MRSATRAIAALLILLVPGSFAVAQTTSDLSVSMSYTGFDDRTIGGLWLPPPTSSGGSITRTRPQRLTINVTNLGPSALSAIFVEFFTPADRSALLTVTEIACTPDRSTPLSGLRLDVGALAPGAARACIVEFRPSAIAPVTFSVPMIMTVFAPGNADPAPANDQARLGAIGALDDYIRDMDLSVRSPIGVLSPGTSHLFDVTLANRGPGLEGSPGFTQVIYSQRYEVGPLSNDRFGFSETGDPDCIYRVTDIGSGTFSRVAELVFGPLPPGASRTCTMRLHVLSGASGVRALEFYNWAEQPGVFDENLANNRASLVLQFPPTPVDAGSPHGWSLLALSILLLTALARTVRRH